jgi:Flp pilus assembly pilin Flp
MPNRRPFGFRRRVEGEAGQGLVEYALILLLVSVAAVAALTPLGPAIAAMFATVQGAF